MALALVTGDLRAAALANWGAVRQARVELGLYCLRQPCRGEIETLLFQHATLERLRREPAAAAPALLAAESTLAAAGPGAGALTRLGALALARRDYPLALERLEAAYALDPRPHATRLLLVDALLANGKRAEALALARPLPVAAGYLADVAWNRYWLDADWPRAAATFSSAATLAPGQADWARRAEEARQRMGQ